MKLDHTANIERLYYRYAYAIDNGDLQGAAKMFENAIIHDAAGKSLAQGAEQVKQFYDRIIKLHPSTGTPKTQHVVSNVLILEQRDDELSATANYSVFQKLDSGNIEAIICGQYHSVFRLAPAGWEFYRHHTKPLMVGDMSNHLKISVRDIANKSNN